MFLQELELENFRSFKERSIKFTDGVNVIIGENNSGKTSVLDALEFIFDFHHRRRPSVWDFWRGFDFDSELERWQDDENDESAEPPQIRIETTLRSSSDSSSNGDTSAEKATVATWLTKLEDPWEAKLTYLFYLPEKYHEEFFNQIAQQETKEERFEILEEFLSDYKSIVYGGEPSTQKRAESEYLAKLDFRHIGALRDAEAELLSGRKPLLRSMLREMYDESETSGEVLDKATEVLDDMKEGVDTDTLFDLVDKTGAEAGGSPKVESSPSISDLLEAMRLYIDQHFSLPLDRNGLGYNNLIYISLVLASMKSSKQDSVFPLLILEEPEAHLHPALQFKLLQYIENEASDSERETAQVILTTHSTHITAGTPLGNIINLIPPSDTTSSPEAISPEKTFAVSVEGEKSKQYVRRHLDATKSTILYSKRVILVEGITEQMLIPILAEHLLNDGTLADYHIEVVAVGGKTFKHFIPLFNQENGLNRKVACIVDKDPQKKINQNPGSYRGCFPYEITNEDDREQSSYVTSVLEMIDTPRFDSIQIHVADEMTLEYDLAYNNSDKSFFRRVAARSHQDFPDWNENGNFLNECENFIREKGEENLIELVDELSNNDVFATAVMLAIEGGTKDKANFIQGVINELENEQSPIEVPQYISNAVDHVAPVEVSS